MLRPYIKEIEMKITDLYKNRSFPWITFVVAVCCVFVTLISVVKPEAYNSLAWSNSPQYIWQYISGAFLHGTGSGFSMAIMHLIANFLMFIPYGVMIEKLIGHKRFGAVFIVSWLGVSAVFQLIALVISKGETAYGAGLSGSSYAVIVMGVYILFKLFQSDKSKFFRQPLAYIFLSGLIGELFLLMPFVAGVASMVLHLAGIVIGVIMTFVFRKSICDNLKID